ncbi:DUF1918 domain-containing protein [Nonomuraea sp. NPDC049709]|uniref:DUF1918 domain-containing protein n=1 Tax=Nonomuraea sp. NPDC049709 TaxID=3154736 RepID=UPI003440BAA9
MQANVGDTIVVPIGRGQAGEQRGEILEVHGEDGRPPYLVRFDDGHTTRMFPGPDCTVVPA